MGNELSTQEKASKMAFLCKKISTHESNMAYWLTIPEFVNVLYTMFEQGKVIDDSSVLNLMKVVYRSKEEAQVPNSEFNYRWARRAIIHIEKALLI